MLLLVASLSCVLVVGEVAGLELVPPPNIWVREQQTNVTLVCAASEKIRSCSWTTPYGEQYPLQPDLFAEGGRLMHYAADRDLECGLMIARLETKDHGRWKCNVGVVENSEVRTASGLANISIATPPTDVFIAAPFHQLTSNFSHGGVNKVECTAKNSRPAPSFRWTVDEDILEHETENVFDEDAAVFTQVLHFVPALEHANKTLRCTVQHPGLDQAVSAATEVRLLGEAAASAVGGLGLGPLVGIVVCVVAAVLAAVLVFARRRISGDKDEVKKPSDEETGTEEKPTEEPVVNEKDDTTNNDNSVNNPEEKKGFEIRSKVVKIIASLKTSKEKKIAEDVAASEFEKVDLTEDNEEKKDEEKTEDMVDSTRQNFGSKLASFISKFKSPAKQQEVAGTAEEEAAKEEEEVDTNPEKPEEPALQRRRGSETPV